MNFDVATVFKIKEILILLEINVESSIYREIKRQNGDSDLKLDSHQIMLLAM